MREGGRRASIKAQETASCAGSRVMSSEHPTPKPRSIALLLTTIAWLVYSSGGWTQTAKSSPDASARVDALLAPWATRDSPGAAVMVIREGHVLHSKGYGLANRAQRQPFTTSTPSLIGSMAKQFTAMAIMLLAEGGALKYDDTLSRFLPDLRPDVGRITIRQLLNHTSGLARFEDVLASLSSNSSTPKDVLRVYLSRELRFKPGDGWEYSNGGYVVLTHVIAAAAGKPYIHFMRERVFNRLNMRNSFFMEEPAFLSARRATGYFREWYGLKVSETLEPLRFYNGSGDLFTTAEDLYLWDQALYPDQLVKRDTLEQAFTGGRLNDGSPLLYGFGWEVFRYKETRYAIHAGGWAGFKSFIIRFPDHGVSVIALSNSDRFDINKLPVAIARIYLADAVPLPKKIGERGE
jgi:CubicO group peptidase (beta-lactamase class C family)